jgi:hypothetical protein
MPALSEVTAQSVRSRVAFLQREAAQSPFDDRPESGAFHGLAGRALPTVLECSASHLNTVLLLGQFGQLVIDHLPLALPLAPYEMTDLSQRESISRKKRITLTSLTADAA